MKAKVLVSIVVLCFLGVLQAQQFRIGEYDGESVTIEYPPSFDGAYLFVQTCSNLSGQAWETVDYSQVNLVEGDSITYNGPAVDTVSAMATTNDAVDIPYEITPEYIEALHRGEIDDTAWQANSILGAARNGASGFFRVFAISFRDDDGDGVDNITEYENGTSPYTDDAPEIDLPDDDGDPRSVPGSVDSAPGDWNAAPAVIYQSPGQAYQRINLLELALYGERGTYPAGTPVDVLGEWVAMHCATWMKMESDEYPRSYCDYEWWYGRFYRTEDESFQWENQEHIYPLTLWDCTISGFEGSTQFTNHLVQYSLTDRPGLARLSDGTPVCVDYSEHLWTLEKVNACLNLFETMVCRLRNTTEDYEFDATDTCAMAEAEYVHSFDPDNPQYYPWSYYTRPGSVGHTRWIWDTEEGEWTQTALSKREVWYINERFTFTDHLQQYGFGPTTHRGYVKIEPAFDEWREGFPTATNASLYVVEQPPPDIVEGVINKTFTCTDGEQAWFYAGDINWSAQNRIELPEEMFAPGALDSYELIHAIGNFYAQRTLYESDHYHWQALPDDYTVLSTLDLPPISSQTLVMDSDRDGTISTNDLARVDESHPYRFWVNEDGNNAEYEEADMEDFFPAMFVAPEVAETQNISFKLSANIEINYIPTVMTSNDCQEYLHDIDLAQGFSGQIQTLNAGIQSTDQFSENEIVLLAASEVSTNAQIYVHLLEAGLETAVFTNYFSFTSITNMYRIQNFRTGGISSLDEPSNWPDELTNGKDLVYVHGFNVKDEFEFGDLSSPLDTPARMWHRNIFKRLWFAGSNAKYHGVIWDGIGQGSMLTHYQNSVVNAFATAPWLADYLTSLNGTETVILGHSLGNMVVSSAICEHNAPVSQYYAIDAAVSLEAYGDVTTNAALIPDVVFTWKKDGFLKFDPLGWRDYPHETWCSEWYRLFDSADPRSKLTWRHKFADIQTRTDVFNFYSSTEDVLRVRDDVDSLLNAVTGVDIDFRVHLLPVDVNVENQCAWQLQEMYKGMNNWAAKYGGGGSDKYAGWSFTEADGEHIRSQQIKIRNTRPPSYITKHYCEQPFEAKLALDTNAANRSVRNAYLENLKTDPLFNRTPTELFEGDVCGFVTDTVGNHTDVLNYDNAQRIGDPDIDVSNVIVRDWLLAKGFPSRTGPMGSSANSNLVWRGINFDMFTQFRTDPNKWPSHEVNGPKIWKHSDWKNVPYVHVYKLFEKMTGKGN